MIIIMFLDLAKQLKKLGHESNGNTNCRWCSATLTKGLVKGPEKLKIRGQVATALLRLARILRRVLVTCGDFLSLKLWGNTIG